MLETHVWEIVAHHFALESLAKVSRMDSWTATKIKPKMKIVVCNAPQRVSDKLNSWVKSFCIITSKPFNNSSTRAAIRIAKRWEEMDIHQELNSGGGMKMDIDNLLMERHNNLILKSCELGSMMFFWRMLLCTVTYSCCNMSLPIAREAVQKTIVWRIENTVVIEQVMAEGLP